MTSQAMVNASKWILVFVLTVTISLASVAALEIGGFGFGIIALAVDWQRGCERYGVKLENCHLNFQGLL